MRLEIAGTWGHVGRVWPWDSWTGTFDIIELWGDKDKLWQVFLGIRRTGEDYFNPWLVLAEFFLGAAIGKAFYKEKKSLLP